MGHRGASAYELENTLASFRKALDLGVDMIEFDVQVLKDGHVVVFHDETVDRLTNGIGSLSDRTLTEVRELDISSKGKIPTIQEVLDLVHKKAQINIDLKGPNMAQPVAKVIEQYVQKKGWLYSDFFVSSHNLTELKKFKGLRPEVRIGGLILHAPFNYMQVAEELGAYALNVKHELVTQELIDTAHKKGFKFFVGTTNEEKDIHAMESLNIDGIFSDYPDRL